MLPKRVMRFLNKVLLGTVWSPLIPTDANDPKGSLASVEHTQPKTNIEREANPKRQRRVANCVLLSARQGSVHRRT